MLKFLQELAKMPKPEQNLRDSAVNAAKALAQMARFQVGESQNGCTVKNKDSAAIEVQFGSRRDFYETIERLENCAADYRVVVTSSNVKSMNIGEIKWVLNNKYQTKNKWLIIDIEHAESPKTVNFMLYGDGTGSGEKVESRPREPRRKKIYGKRGEHKVQD